MTDRPTGVSITKTHYLNSSHAHGAEAFPKLSVAATRDTGFTTGTGAVSDVVPDGSRAYDRIENMPEMRAEKIKKNDPAEFLNITHPNRNSRSASAVSFPFSTSELYNVFLFFAAS